MDTLDREEAAYLRLGMNGARGGGGNADVGQRRSQQYARPGSEGLSGGGATIGGDDAPSVTVPDTQGWDIFRLLPPKNDYIGKGFWHEMSLQVLKVATFFVLFFLTLGSAVVAKSSFLLMINGISWAGKNISVCPDRIPEAAVNEIYIPPSHVTKWIWAAFISLCAPEVVCFIRCLHRTLFRNVRRPTLMQFFVVLIVESLHAFGVGMLVFMVLPDMPADTAAMVSNALCLVPSILSALSRKAAKLTMFLIIIDIAAIVPQSAGFWSWPVLVPEIRSKAFAISCSLVLISLAWWQNFVHRDSFLPPIRSLGTFANRLSERRSKTYVIVSLWKCVIYLLCLFFFITPRFETKVLLQRDPFGEKLIHITASDLSESQMDNFIKRMSQLGNNFEEGRYYEKIDSTIQINQYTNQYDALWVALIQIGSVLVCYHSSKFACKVMMQRMGFALPITLTVPVTVMFLASSCAMRQKDACHMTSILRKDLFWQCSPNSAPVWSVDFWMNPQTWFWLAWLGSQIWVTIHLWTPKHERLARSEKLFILSYYSAVFIDQSLAFNRRCDDKAKIKAEFQDLDVDNEDSSQTYETIGPGQMPKPPPSVCSVSSSKLESGLIRETASAADAITKIYVCATMWHESALEMTCMLKSIFRLDEDQCARRNAQKYLKVVDPDYYEFEAHIFVDDAYDVNEYGEPVINKFVKQLIDKIDDAASAIHQCMLRLKPPKKFTTPYGGRLCYVMPGKNRLTIHLKNKNQIRHRKRWSQVMYLYYLLGYRLMMKVSDQARKEVIAENTFILTLDGDVDFTPQCVHLLVDLMKKNRRLGAACGRIHPRGSGPMIWYQKFEYAVGHWLQKATEHMIGCVLCSPGCFSLFRSYALMDDNVTRKYASKSEQALDYIQYDQGEDRWLCTLLLQRGYRVEYCAASDALTFAPEGFTEFFNQRRRWIPSTIANIIDLLKDYKNVVSVNESISIWYILYQLVMLISSLLGPGTIFLMIVGALSISFNIDTKWALLIVSLPVVLFCIVCMICKPETQMLCAQVVGALFAMFMTAVIVGTSLQIQKDGVLSPHSMFLFTVIGSFITAAVLHPLEFTCIIPGTLYFLAIPCMYMLLPIYSICNLNTVSWGTREDPTLESERPTKGARFELMENGLGADAESDFSLGCGSACRLMCCLGPNKMETSPQIWKINEGIKELTRKIDNLERKANGQVTFSSRISTGMASGSDKWNDGDDDDQAEREDDRELRQQSQAAMRNKRWKQTRSETWLGDATLRYAERDYLEHEEESFWTDMIDRYLQPIAVDAKEQSRITKSLTDLRNKVSSAFFMLNIVFIIVVLILQMQKESLYIEWPIGYKNETVHDKDDYEIVRIVRTRLHLEPIGLVFLVFFMSILVIQFFAMLMHRFGTLAHIIASTELFCFKKKHDKISDEDLVVQNAVEIARELQAIRGVDEFDDSAQTEEQGISRRRVVQNLESSRRSMMKRRTETLDAAFKKRFFALSSADLQEEMPLGLGGREKRLTLKKGTIRALEQRRDSLFGTMDKRTDNPYSENAENQSRGPAQRRLDRIFNQNDVGKTPESKM